jgi:glycosyltransferase involved in cell wall biosynthesis
MEGPLITCIVPAYNVERYISEAIDSILAQTYQPLRIVVADDGSTDRTGEIAAGYGERITYLRQSNQGYPAAKNLGLSAAQGDFIAFLDADDVWHPEKLARQIERFKERPEMDLCFTRYKNFWMPELAEEERRYQGHPLSEPQSSWSISTLLARRAVFEKFGNFHDGTRGIENTTWFLRAAGRGAKIEILTDILMSRRFNQESVTRQKGYFENLLPIVKEWRDYRRRVGL